MIIVPLMRARTEGTLGDSIGSFRRHLSVLERAAPRRVAPANRLRMTSATSIPPYRPSVSAPARTASHRQSAVQRRQAQKRRRDIFVALVVGMAFSALLAMIPGLAIMWTVNIVVDLLFAGYVALLVRMRNLAAEREMKLTFLPAPAPLAARYSPSPYGRGHTVAVGLADLARRAN